MKVYALTPGCCFEKVAAPHSLPLAPSDILKVKHMGLHFLYVLKDLSKFFIFLKIVSLMKPFVSLLTYFAMKH